MRLGDRFEKDSRAFFDAGPLVMVLGIGAGLVWGAGDAVRLFCSSAVLAISWILGFIAARGG